MDQQTIPTTVCRTLVITCLIKRVILTVLQFYSRLLENAQPLYFHVLKRDIALGLHGSPIYSPLL